MPQGAVHLKSLFMPYMNAFMTVSSRRTLRCLGARREVPKADFLENLNSHRCKHWNPCLWLLCLHAVRSKSLNREWHPTCPLSSWSWFEPVLIRKCWVKSIAFWGKEERSAWSKAERGERQGHCDVTRHEAGSWARIRPWTLPWEASCTQEMLLQLAFPGNTTERPTRDMQQRDFSPSLGECGSGFVTASSGELASVGLEAFVGDGSPGMACTFVCLRAEALGCLGRGHFSCNELSPDLCLGLEIRLESGTESVLSPCLVAPSNEVCFLWPLLCLLSASMKMCLTVLMTLGCCHKCYKKKKNATDQVA